MPSYTINNFRIFTTKIRFLVWRYEILVQMPDFGNFMLHQGTAMTERTALRRARVHAAHFLGRF